jgi:hemoglobin-like flavoprotein
MLNNNKLVSKLYKKILQETPRILTVHELGCQNVGNKQKPLKYTWTILTLGLKVDNLIVALLWERVGL